MPVPGIDFIAAPHSFLDFFGRLGIQSTNIRGIYNALFPMALIRRDRDDQEGSVFAMTVETPGAANQFSAAAFGSAFNDWELLALNISHRPPNTGVVYDTHFHVFSPLAPYNPVATPNPVGIFTPGLITNHATTFGTVGGIGGYAPTLPIAQGLMLRRFRSAITANGTWLATTFEPGLSTYVDPPIRLYRDQTIAVQSLTAFAGGGLGLAVAILYREFARVTADPGT